nr:uncharacterized protein LOC114921443 isoform X1 [Labrus bergylta]
MYPKRSKKRKDLLNLLRKQGNRAHNIEVLKNGEGTLVPCRQQIDQHASPTEYQHCFACFGLFKRKALWKHAKRCVLAEKIRKTLPGKTRIQSLCAGAQPVPKEVNKKVWALVNRMTQGEIVQAIKEDIYIMKVGEKMYNRQRESASQHDNIRQTLRGLGRLLVVGRKVTPLRKIADYINPKNFHHFIRAVKEVTGYDENINKFEKPTLATKLGQSIQRVADIIEAEALVSQSNEKKMHVQEFRRMYTLSWNELISSAAYRTLEENKWNKPKLIPLADDVKKMHIYMTNKQKEDYEQLSKKKTPKNWSNLAKVTLAQIILFNRRREGEVSNMYLETYVARDSSPLNEDVAEALSELEKMLCHHFERVEIRGKRGRKVPIILTPAMVKSLELLVTSRDLCGVVDNPYLFARPGFETRLRGSDCIRELARSCGAQKPEAFSSTKLRKQVATLSRVLNLNDTEQDLLADFLGHDIRVHRKFYRLPEGTLHLAKISKVLMACEQGRLADFKGKSLDQISISPQDGTEALEESSGLSSEDEEQKDNPTVGEEEGTSKQQLEDEQSSEELSVTEDRGSTPKNLQQNRALRGRASVARGKKDTSNHHQEEEKSSEEELSVTKDRQSTSKWQFGRKTASRGGASVTQDKKGTPQQLDNKQSPQRERKPKRMWSEEEVQAVEKSLMRFIRMGKTPGKKDCEMCISAADEALAQRDWRAVKFYVHNRIVSEGRL